MASTKKMKDQVMKPKRKSRHKRLYVSAGFTVLNLACSGRPDAALRTGKFYLFCGGSNSGKTWVVHAVLAEASIDPAFDDYDFYYDDAEDGALMDIKRYFGRKLYRRLKAPRYDESGFPVHSETLEDFYYGMKDIIDQGRPFIYILDSMDAITSKEEMEQFEKGRKANKKGQEEAGTYGTSKAKKNSAYIRIIRNGLKKTNSILIIISQSRANFGFASQFNPDTRSGGRALTFYATLEIWTKLKKNIEKKDTNQKTRQQGIISQIKITKNRQTGRGHKIDLPIYHSHGIDDTGGCIDWLLDEKHWSKQGGKINAKEFGKKLTREKLIHWIEENEKERKLQLIVANVWKEIEKASSIKRKNKYQ